MEESISEESERAQHYLDKKTEEKILAVLDEELITKHMDTIVHMENSGLVHMLTHERLDGEWMTRDAIDVLADLRRFYKLLKRVSRGLETMTSCMSAYLRQQGEALVNCDQMETAAAGAGCDAPARHTPITFIQASVQPSPCSLLSIVSRCWN